MKQFFFLILRVINAIEILRNRVFSFFLTRHFTTSKRGKKEFLIMHSTEIHLREMSKKYHKHAFFYKNVVILFRDGYSEIFGGFQAYSYKKKRVLLNLIFNHVCFIPLRDFCYFISINCLKCSGMVRNSSLLLLGTLYTPF